MASNIKKEIASDDDDDEILDNNELILPTDVKVQIKEEQELNIENNDEQNVGFFTETDNDDKEEDMSFCYENDDEGPSISGQNQNCNTSEFVAYEIVEYDNYETEDKYIANKMVMDDKGSQSVNASSNDDHMNVTPMNEWVVYRYMKMCCHLCGATFQHHVYKWLIHMKQQHPEIINKMESLYHMYCKNVAHCKICKKNISPEFNHVYHFMNKHYSTAAQPTPFVCTFCEYADSSFSSLQKHQVENHPLVSTKCEKCPKCCKPFRDAAAVEYHFMTAHVEEFDARYVCKCHLCKNFSAGSNKEEFFNHLMEEHKLDNWKVLNFRKMETSPHLLCTKCFKIYINTDIHNLLNHHLTHDEKSSWKCKFCRCKNLFKDWPLPHLCRAMWQYYEKQAKDTEEYKQDDEDAVKPNITETAVTTASTEAARFIAIMCTLCDNKQFSDTAKIITHFRTTHNCFDEHFEKATKDRNRVCKICQTTMNRDKPSDIMIHFLKHLDERPYKCVSCLRSFIEFRAAQKHVKVFHLTNSIDIIGNMNASGMPIQEERKTKKVVCLNNTNSFKVFEPFIVYACPECNEVSPNLDAWDEHINAQHTFFQASNLNIVFFGNGKGKCTDCNTVISISMSLQKTHKLTHMQYTPYICAICYERFSMLISLYRHMRNVHLVNGTIQCPICPRVSATDCENFEHLKKEHPCSEWPSNMCIKCYRIVNDMKGHRLSHEVVQPKYRCECCGIYIAYHKDLVRHMQEMHGQIIVSEKISKRKKASKRKAEAEAALLKAKSDNKEMAILPEDAKN